MQRELRFLLGYYSESNEEPCIDSFVLGLVHDNMNVLTAALHPGCALSTLDCTRLADALSNIGHAAEAMGYPAVKAALDEVRAKLPSAGKPLTRKRRAGIAQKLSAPQALISEMICRIEAGAT